MRLLLFSNSTNYGEAYFEYPLPYIADFLPNGAKRAVFIPYAGVTISYQAYAQKVSEQLARLNILVQPIHQQQNQQKAIEQADCIIIGGGNTWQLTKLLHEKGLMDTISQQVQSGTPYIGWSAGSNMACPTMKTTNDMPIVHPGSFNTLALIPFQLNPHYLDANTQGHNGETRQERIMEFIQVNPELKVLGLREGTLLRREGQQLSLLGPKTARLFSYQQTPVELSEQDSLNFLL